MECSLLGAESQVHTHPRSTNLLLFVPYVSHPPTVPGRKAPRSCHPPLSRSLLHRGLRSGETPRKEKETRGSAGATPGTTPGCGAARRCEAETLPGMAGKAHSIPGDHSFGATRRRTAIPRAGWGQPGEGARLTIVSRLGITAGGVLRSPRRYRRKVLRCRAPAAPPPHEVRATGTGPGQPPQAEPRGREPRRLPFT